MTTMTQLAEHLIHCGRGTRNLARAGLSHFGPWVCFFAISLFLQGDDLYLNNANLPSGTYQATNNIIAGPSLVISGGSSVTFNAGSTVFLEPGFRAAAGSSFHASIVGLPGPPVFSLCVSPAFPTGTAGNTVRHTITTSAG